MDIFQLSLHWRYETRAGFVSKFSADLSQLLFSTYFDIPGALAIDASGMAYVAGTTTLSPQQAFIAKIAKVDPVPSRGNTNHTSKVIVLQGSGMEPARVDACIVSESANAIGSEMRTLSALVVVLRADAAGRWLARLRSCSSLGRSARQRVFALR